MRREKLAVFVAFVPVNISLIVIIYIIGPIYACHFDLRVAGQFEAYSTASGPCILNLLILHLILILSLAVNLVKLGFAIRRDVKGSRRSAKLRRQMNADKEKPVPDGWDTHFPGAADMAPLLAVVPCYSEGVHELGLALDSLTKTHYRADRFCLCFVVDGLVYGKGNNKTTADILRHMLSKRGAVRTGDVSAKLTYQSTAEEQEYRANRATVESGWMTLSSRKVPYMIIVKCGMKFELDTEKCGNRGKRDSQLIILDFLRRQNNRAGCFSAEVPADSLVSYRDSPDGEPLDQEIERQMKGHLQLSADAFQYLVFSDADTFTMPDAIPLIADELSRKPRIAAACGEVEVYNRWASGITAFTVYEYFLQNRILKATETLYGKVSCLTGACSFLRIRSAYANGGPAVKPLATDARVCDLLHGGPLQTQTLHLSNLYCIGEDRWLTVCLMRQHPDHQIQYYPEAVFETIVPSTFRDFLSQRRRWINSFLVNTLQLILHDNHRRFFHSLAIKLVALEQLFLLMFTPVLLLLILYFILGLILQPEAKWNWLSIAAFAPVFMPLCVAVLGGRGKRAIITFVPFVLLGMPLTSSLAPVYAFWNLDDVSWGRTQRLRKSNEKALEEGKAKPRQRPTKPVDDVVTLPAPVLIDHH